MITRRLRIGERGRQVGGDLQVVEILTVIPASAMLLSMTSLCQTGTGMISACLDLFGPVRTGASRKAISNQSIKTFNIWLLFVLASITSGSAGDVSLFLLRKHDVRGPVPAVVGSEIDCGDVRLVISRMEKNACVLKEKESGRFYPPVAIKSGAVLALGNRVWIVACVTNVPYPYTSVDLVRLLEGLRDELAVVIRFQQARQEIEKHETELAAEKTSLDIMRGKRQAFVTVCRNRQLREMDARRAVGGRVVDDGKESWDDVAEYRASKARVAEELERTSKTASAKRTAADVEDVQSARRHDTDLFSDVIDAVKDKQASLKRNLSKEEERQLANLEYKSSIQDSGANSGFLGRRCWRENSAEFRKYVARFADLFFELAMMRSERQLAELLFKMDVDLEASRRIQLAELGRLSSDPGGTYSSSIADTKLSMSASERIKQVKTHLSSLPVQKQKLEAQHTAEASTKKTLLATVRREVHELIASNNPSVSDTTAFLFIEHKYSSALMELEKNKRP